MSTACLLLPEEASKCLTCACSTELTSLFPKLDVTAESPVLVHRPNLQSTTSDDDNEEPQSTFLEVPRPPSPQGSIDGEHDEDPKFRFLLIPCHSLPAQSIELLSHRINLDDAIAQENQTIAHIPVTDPSRFSHLNTLAHLLHVRYLRHKEHKDLALALTYRRRHLSSLDPDSFHAAVSRLALAKLYHSLFHRSGTISDLFLAIKQCALALEVPTSELSFSSLRSLILRERGVLYACLYRSDSTETHLRAAHENFKESLESMASNHPERSTTLTYLIHVLLWHFNLLGASEGGRDYLDVAVSYQEEAVDVVGQHTTILNTTVGGHGHARSSALAIYAELLRQRFEYSGKLDDLKHAVARAQDAFDLTPRRCSYYPRHLTLYVKCLMTRFRALGRLDDINKASELHRELELSCNVLLQAEYLHSLANLWITAFEWFQQQKHLNRAVALLQSAVRDHLDREGEVVDRAEYLYDLGKALTLRFGCTKNLEEIEDAIVYGKNAVARTPPGSDKKQYRLLALASSLSVKFECYHQLADIEQAIQHQNAALATLKSRSHFRVTALKELGHSLLRKSKHTKDPTDREKGINCLREAATAPYGLPHDCFKAALLWANFMHVEGNAANDVIALLLALEGYTHAIRRLLPRVAWVGLDASSRLIQLRCVPPMLASDAAACAFRISELSMSNRARYIEQAVELLDWGRSILWSQSSQFRAELQALHDRRPELARQLHQAAQKLDQTALDDTGERERQELVKKWEELSTRVRCHHGFEHFNCPMPFSTLKKATMGTSSVVIVNVSTFRCDGIVIPPSGDVKIVQLRNLEADDVQWMVDDFKESLTMRKGSKQLRGVLYDVWDKITGPILQHLPQQSLDEELLHVRWCLTGQLAFLPLHASYPRPKKDIPPKDRKGVLDRVISSYIPTLSSLLRVSLLRRQSSFQFLAVTHSSVKGYAPLDHAEDEVQLLHTLPQADSFKFLSNSNATLATVTTELRSKNWVHFACHGQQDPAQPMHSSLILHDAEHLSLTKIADERPYAGEFAMLLACESAKGAEGLGDEALHMAAGLLFSGFRSVIATMWSIRDDYGPEVAKMVYGHLFRAAKQENSSAPQPTPDSAEAALALHKAILYLRDTKKSPIREWAPFIHFGI